MFNDDETITKDLTCCETLEKRTLVNTLSYNITSEGVDEDGLYDADIELTENLETVWKEQEYTISEILEAIPKLLMRISSHCALTVAEQKDVRILAQACEGWEQMDINVTEN